jgi:mycothiol system anti-sigma-R factor
VTEPECNEALRELYVFLDGELTVERRDTIRRHLDGCHHCLEVFDFEAELKLIVARKCADTPPAHLMERIAGALREAERSP